MQNCTKKIIKCLLTYKQIFVSSNLHIQYTMVTVNMDIMKSRNRKNSFLLFSLKSYHKLNRYKEVKNKTQNWLPMALQAHFTVHVLVADAKSKLLKI